MAMAIVLCVFALDHVGGVAPMWDKLETLYPSNHSQTDLDGNVFLDHEQIKSFVPSFDSSLAGSLGIPFSAFVLTLTFMWWTNGNVDGAGFFAQRLYSAENAREAQRGSMWYGFAHFVLRSWPWVIAGVIALILFPRTEVNVVAKQFNDCLEDTRVCSSQQLQCLDDRFECQIKEYDLLYKKSVFTSKGEQVQFREDRERSYPALIKQVLPSGLMGLALVALMGAFMSTVSTHINWGASYIANDFFLRFVNPKANNKTLLFVSRVSTVFITVIAVLVASQIENVGTMWELYLGMMAGLGLPHLLRWFWWRANAWTELSGMVTGVCLALLNYVAAEQNLLPEGYSSIFPPFMANHPIHVICWISVVSALVSIGVTLATPAVNKELLQQFIEKTQPMGFWKDLIARDNSLKEFNVSMVSFVCGCVGLYSGMFGIGYLFIQGTSAGLALLTLSILSLYAMLKGLERLEELRLD